MKAPSIRKPQNYWTKWENVEKEFKIIIENNGGKFPTGDQLHNSGLNGLYSSLSNYHGGLKEVRKRLGHDNPSVKPRGYWKDIGNVITETLTIMRELGCEELPGQRILDNRGYHSLASSIALYHGGFPAFREVLRTRIGVRSENDKLFSLLEHYVVGDSGK